MGTSFETAECLYLEGIFPCLTHKIGHKHVFRPHDAVLPGCGVCGHSPDGLQQTSPSKVPAEPKDNLHHSYGLRSPLCRSSSHGTPL